MSGGITPTMNKINLMEVKAKMAMPPMTMQSTEFSQGRSQGFTICAVSEATRDSTPQLVSGEERHGQMQQVGIKVSADGRKALSVTITNNTTLKIPPP